MTTKQVPGSHRLIKVNLTLSGDQLEYVTGLARQRGANVSQTVREIVEAARQAATPPTADPRPRPTLRPPLRVDRPRR